MYYCCRLTLIVIKHIAAYPASLPAVLNAAENVDVLIDLLQTYRDVPSIFTSATRLLHIILTFSADRRGKIRENPELMRRLVSLENILARKLAMNKKSPLDIAPLARAVKAIATPTKRRLGTPSKRGIAAIQTVDPLMEPLQDIQSVLALLE